MHDNEELPARLRKLEDENRRLSARIDELTAEEPVNRRGMFKRVALGAATLTVGANVVTAPEAAAGDGDGAPIRFGVMNMGTSTTSMMMDAIGAPGLDVDNTGATDQNDMSCAIRGRTYTFGVVGMGESRAGVVGMCTLDEKDLLTVNQPAGVAGISRTPGASGVYGRSADAQVAVQGVSNSGNGVAGTSLSARGGVFTGGAAQIKLVPGNAATPPSSGQHGDLYVDSTGRLWFYRAGWHNIA